MKPKLLHLLLFASIVFTAFSCKKDDAKSDYFFKITKDGVETSYPIVAGELGPDLADPSFTDLGIRGQSENGNDILDLTIQVTGKTFSTGTYSSDNPDYQVIFSYLVKSGNSLSNYDISDATGRAPSKYIVTITSITSDEITGNFTGNYLYDDFSTSAGIFEIPKGSFHVKRIR